MPITWDAAAEAKLMSAIFTVCDVKVSQPQMKQLAEIMGSDCTPKAITHRLAKLRKGSAENITSKDDSEPKAKKSKTAHVKKGARQTTKKRASTPVDPDDEEPGRQLTPPTTVDRYQRNGGIKRAYGEVKEEPVDDDDDGITVGEDIGQGEIF